MGAFHPSNGLVAGALSADFSEVYIAGSMDSTYNSANDGGETVRGETIYCTRIKHRFGSTNLIRQLRNWWHVVGLRSHFDKLYKSIHYRISLKKC